MRRSRQIWVLAGLALAVATAAIAASGCDEKAAPPACTTAVACAPLQHVCDCTDGAYCLAGSAECINPTAACPATGDVLACAPSQHVCRCADGAYCLAGNAECLNPTARCPTACD